MPQLSQYFSEFIKRRVYMGLDLQDIDSQLAATTASLEKARAQKTKTLANTTAQFD